MNDAKFMLLNLGLYQVEEFEVTDYAKLFELKYFNETIDFHCVECEKSSTFIGKNGSYLRSSGNNMKYDSMLELQKRFPESHSEWEAPILNMYYYVKFDCTRNINHKTIFIFKVTNNTLEKIGQYPSLASMTTPELKKYKKILFPEQYKELNRGIGLITHGVGIGSFVYLRRIFENLIEESHQKALILNGWDEEKFKRSRMDEKIELLNEFLPKTLVDSKDIYAILSKGIHELIENECIRYFPILKAGIELILEEKLYHHQQSIKHESIISSISKIRSELK